MGVSRKGNGTDCNFAYWIPGYGRGGENFVSRAWCCPSGEQSQFDQVSPVPLEWLFVDNVSEDAEVDIEMKVQAEADENQDPNENGFGWVIMAGPEEYLTSLDKRDGSHWELFDRRDRHDARVRRVLRRRDEMRSEVDQNHGGSWQRFAEHKFREHRRSTPKDQMHEFHRRWFSEDGDIEEWMDAMEAISEHEWEETVDLPTHRIQDTFLFWLFHENLDCELWGIPYNAYFSVWADLHIDIRTSAQLTLIVSLFPSPISS